MHILAMDSSLACIHSATSSTSTIASASSSSRFGGRKFRTEKIVEGDCVLFFPKCHKNVKRAL